MTESVMIGRDLHVIASCPTCSTKHTLPESLYETARARRGPSGTWVYCPHGHRWHYTEGESEKDKLRRERNQLQQLLARKDDDLNRLRESERAAWRSASAHKGQVTKLKNRSKAGVCPCCNRTFKQLAAHMKNKHPNFDPEEPLKLIDGGVA